MVGTAASIAARAACASASASVAPPRVSPAENLGCAAGAASAPEMARQGKSAVRTTSAAASVDVAAAGGAELDNGVGNESVLSTRVAVLGKTRTWNKRK